MLEHLQWQHERDMAVVTQLVGTLDRVIGGKFDRPQIGHQEIPAMRQSFTPDDLVDVLDARTDEEFFEKVDRITQ